MFNQYPKVMTVEAAYRGLLKQLEKKGITIYQVSFINSNRYIIVKTSEGNILITYKREPFYNFGKMFRKEGAKGLADTVNRDDLKTAVSRGCDKIFTIFQNGTVYTITMSKFLEKSYPWVNKEGKEVRSISIHEFEKFCEV